MPQLFGYNINDELWEKIAHSNTIKLIFQEEDKYIVSGKHKSTMGNKEKNRRIKKQNKKEKQKINYKFN